MVQTPKAKRKVVDAAIGAAEAGAAIAHLYARDPKTGEPDQTRKRSSRPEGDQAALELRREPDLRRRALPGGCRLLPAFGAVSF